MKTTVVNLKRDPYDVYIGREGRGFEGPFGNPYLVAKDSRDRAIEKFSIYFYTRMEFDPIFREKVLALKGKRLGCFCKPQACHGDVIAEYLDGLADP